MKWLASLAVSAIEWLFSAWVFMVIVGIVHDAWLPQVPTIGYRLAMLLTGLVTAALAVRALLTAVVSGLLGDDS